MWRETTIPLFIYHSFFSFFFCIKCWSSPDWKCFFLSYIYIYIYIYSGFIIIHLKGFHRQEFSFVVCCLGCTVIVPPRRNALFFFLIREGVNTHSEGRWVFLWPLPLSQDEATPPVEAPLQLLCGVLIDSFPSIHGGSPWALPGAVLVLYLMEGWLPVHTNWKQRRWGAEERGGGVEEKWRDWKDGCEDRGKVRREAGGTIIPSW